MAKKILGFFGFLVDDNGMATAVRQGDMRTFRRVEEETACEPQPPPRRPQGGGKPRPYSVRRQRTE